MFPINFLANHSLPQSRYFYLLLVLHVVLTPFVEISSSIVAFLIYVTIPGLRIIPVVDPVSSIIQYSFILRRVSEVIPPFLINSACWLSFILAIFRLLHYLRCLELRVDLIIWLSLICWILPSFSSLGMLEFQIISRPQLRFADY